MKVKYTLLKILFLISRSEISPQEQNTKQFWICSTSLSCSFVELNLPVLDSLTVCTMTNMMTYTTTMTVKVTSYTHFLLWQYIGIANKLKKGFKKDMATCKLAQQMLLKFIHIMKSLMTNINYLNNTYNKNIDPSSLNLIILNIM
jgi:hypothetical protein